MPPSAMSAASQPHCARRSQLQGTQGDRETLSCMGGQWRWPCQHHRPMPEQWTSATHQAGGKTGPVKSGPVGGIKDAVFLDERSISAQCAEASREMSRSASSSTRRVAESLTTRCDADGRPGLVKLALAVCTPLRLEFTGAPAWAFASMEGPLSHDQ